MFAPSGDWSGWRPPSPLDNRISYGCINLPKAFYERTVRSIFLAGSAIVYVLPETKAGALLFFPELPDLAD